MGPAGPQGTPGVIGATGATGPQGLTGAQGPIGPQGIPGDNGTNGTQGPIGPQGIPGVNGTNGTQGPIGPQGLPGVNGTNGVNGTDGATGPQGPSGQQGSQGPSGPQGVPGLNGTAVVNGTSLEVLSVNSTSGPSSFTGGLTVVSVGETITAGGLTVTSGGINNNFGGITNAGAVDVAILNASGDINTVGGKVKEQGNSLLPRGAIIMFSGQGPPAGWAVCDGGNGTPDLRDRFVVGAGSGYGVGNTGGQATVTLTTDEIPAHSHTFSGLSFTYNIPLENDAPDTSISQYAQTSSQTANTGAGSPHENRPPYFALLYIMKL